MISIYSENVILGVSLSPSKDSLLQPAKMNSGHFVETLVERPIEIAQPINGGRINVRMIAALRFAQTMRTGLGL